MGILVCLALIVFLMFLGVPLGLSFGVGGVLAISVMGINPKFLVPVAYQAIDSFTVLAIPLYVLAGNLMTEGGLSTRLVDFAYTILGRVRGGLGAVIPVSCMLFGAMSGSSSATIAAIGSAVAPRMQDYGYERVYIGALVSVSGWLGNMIPPSVVLIVYCLVANQSVAALFLSTVVPGIMIGVLLILVNVYYGARHIHHAHDQSESITQEKTGVAALQYIKDVGRSSIQALPALIMPVIILGGIYGGVFTPTEAAAVACAYALLAGVSFRKLNLRVVRGAVYESATLFATLGIIIFFITPLSRISQTELIPQKLMTFMLSMSDNKYVIMALINLLILIAGMFIDTIVLVMIVTPIFAPICLSLNINLVHFGAFMMVGLGIGTITPPVCEGIFVASTVLNIPFQRMLKPALIFSLFSCFPVLFITTYVPEISLWLPRLVMGPSVVPY